VDLARALAWLAPVAACMVLALAAARQEAGSADATRPEYVFAMMLSNQTPSNVLPDDGSQSENRVERASFAWTNHGDSGSSIRFMPFTNSSY
jgi:hypothetical protein